MGKTMKSLYAIIIVLPLLFYSKSYCGAFGNPEFERLYYCDSTKNSLLWQIRGIKELNYNFNRQLITHFKLDSILKTNEFNKIIINFENKSIKSKDFKLSETSFLIGSQNNIVPFDSISSIELKERNHVLKAIGSAAFVTFMMGLVPLACEGLAYAYDKKFDWRPVVTIDCFLLGMSIFYAEADNGITIKFKF
jgi:hypothetical protein